MIQVQNWEKPVAYEGSSSGGGKKGKKGGKKKAPTRPATGTRKPGGGRPGAR